MRIMLGLCGCFSIFFLSGLRGVEFESDLSTRLLEAILGSRADKISYLVSRGANVHITDEGGGSLLHLAAQVGNIDVIAELIDAGLDPSVSANQGETPLHTAAWFGQLGAAKCLLARGARRDLADSSGGLPIRWAVHRGHDEMVRLLLIDPDLVSREKNGPKASRLACPFYEAGHVVMSWDNQ